MIVGKNEYNGITVIDSNTNEVFVVINDQEIIERDGFKVILEPANEN